MNNFVKLSIAVAFIAGCSAQAPGDRDLVRCVESSTYRHTYPDNVKVLMDSWNYEQLLPGHGDQPIPGAVWTDASCDNNDDAQFPFITPPYWQHGAGGICRWQAQVCGYTVGEQNNWLFTQHISKDVPDPNNDDYTVRVFVNVTYSFQSCRTRNRCNPQFKVLKYISNSQQQTKRDSCSDTSLYSGSGIMPSNTIGSEGTDGVVSDMRYFDMTTSQDGLYLALHDSSNGNLRGTCVGISRLIVYRHECPAQPRRLVRYPATQAPVSGTVSVQTQCVDNAHRSSSSLGVRCDSDGYWSSGSPECECDLGYREVTRDGEQVCEACPAGTYRSSGDTDCQPCPANTMRDQVATGQCQCQDGYFRNDVTRDNTCSSILTASNEGAGTGCSQPPGAPASVSVSAVSARSIRVTWSHPSHRGGRSDLHYMVEHSDPDTLGRYTGTTCKGSSSTIHTFSGLRPDTEYCIRVSAHNGVSDQDPDGTHLRTEEMCTTTPPDCPGPVDGVVGHCSVVAWKQPEEPNGEVIRYDIEFFTNEDSKTANTPANQAYYELCEDDIPDGEIVFVKVAAINEVECEPKYLEPHTYIGCPDPGPRTTNGTKPPIYEPTPPGLVKDVYCIGTVCVWTKPDGRVSYYVVVYYKEGKEDINEKRTNETRFTITDKLDGNYFIEVCAVRDDVRGNCSSPVQMDTESDDGDDSDDTLIIVITAVATCVATALAVGLLCCVISVIHHRMYKKRTKGAMSFNGDYELKS